MGWACASEKKKKKEEEREKKKIKVMTFKQRLKNRQHQPKFFFQGEFGERYIQEMPASTSY